MKKVLVFAVLISAAVSSLAKTPVVMVAPSDEWSKQKGYMMYYEIEGLNSAIPDYEAAFVMCPELNDIIVSVNESLSERGFGVRMLESELQKLTNDQVWNSMMQNTEERPLYIAGRMADVDIVLMLTYDLKKETGRYKTNYRLHAVDARTRQVIASQSAENSISGSASDRQEFCRTGHICIIDKLADDMHNYLYAAGYLPEE